MQRYKVEGEKRTGTKLSNRCFGATTPCHVEEKIWTVQKLMCQCAPCGGAYVPCNLLCNINPVAHQVHHRLGGNVNERFRAQMKQPVQLGMLSMAQEICIVSAHCSTPCSRKSATSAKMPRKPLT